MNSLMVVGFHGKHRAEEVLDQLQRLSDDWVIDLDDAVAAYRTDDGRLRIASSVHPRESEGAAVGGAMGILIGALLAAPFTAGVSTAAAIGGIVGSGALAGGAIGALAGGDDAADWKERFGITDDFVREVGGMVQPGDSAVFVLLRSGDPEAVGRHFAGHGGTVLRTTLTRAEAARVQQTIGSYS